MGVFTKSSKAVCKERFLFDAHPRQAKIRFLLFVRILFKRLSKKHPHLLKRCQKVVSDYTTKRSQGAPAYRPPWHRLYSHLFAIIEEKEIWIETHEESFTQMLFFLRLHGNNIDYYDVRNFILGFA